MDQGALGEIMEKILSRAKDRRAQHVRAIHLAVYDPHIQSEELIRALDRLVQETPAQGARLHIRRCKNGPLAPAFDLFDFPQTSLPIRLDSIELE